MTDTLDILFSFLTLTTLEIILGIDNLVFLAIVSQKLPPAQQPLARRLGLSLAWILRLLLLAFAVWIVGLTHPLFTLWGHSFSWHDLFLLGGGLFLLAKSTQEIHIEVSENQEQGTEATDSHSNKKRRFTSFAFAVVQIVLLDVIFSFDSILTAVGLTTRFWLMAIAITIAIIIMLFASEPMSRFIEKHPTIKMLALSFLLLIGTMLLADGFGFHIPRGYIYFAMGFSLFVECLNMRRRKKK